MRKPPRMESAIATVDTEARVIRPWRLMFMDASRARKPRLLMLIRISRQHVQRLPAIPAAMLRVGGGPRRVPGQPRQRRCSVGAVATLRLIADDGAGLELHDAA